DPIAPTDSSCQHYVCRGCKGQRMQLKPSCSWCKDYSRFQENRQLSLLVHCYKKLCLYIARSPLAPHIATAADDSPDLQAILDEGLALAESESLDGEEDVPDAAAGQLQEASTLDEAPAPAPPQQQQQQHPLSVDKEEEEEEEESSPVVMGVNGLHDCNGLVDAVDTLQSITIETGGGVLKQDAFGDELPMCVSVTTAAGEAGLCDIAAFTEDLKHDGGSLLLSVEEVLRTLDTDPEPEPAPPVALAVVPSSTPPDPTPPPDCVPQSSLNGPHCPTGPDSSRLTPSIPPEDGPRSQQRPPLTTVPRAPLRCHRKRSRSESDSEKLQPLPISSLLHGPLLGGPLLGPSSSPHHPGPGATAAAATTKREPKFPNTTHHPLPHLAPVPNGGPPKVGKTVLVSSSKGLKKTVEHHG
ncbi:hypothetical protein CRUP_035925, partial [Coryphaenoides rupestris]